MRIGRQSLKITRCKPFGEILIIKNRAVDNRKGQRENIALLLCSRWGFANMLFRLVPNVNIATPYSTAGKKHTCAKNSIKARVGIKEIPCVLIHLGNLAAAIGNLRLKESVRLGVINKQLRAFVRTANLVI